MTGHGLKYFLHIKYPLFCILQNSISHELRIPSSKISKTMMCSKTHLLLCLLFILLEDFQVFFPGHLNNTEAGASRHHWAISWDVKSFNTSNKKVNTLLWKLYILVVEREIHSGDCSKCNNNTFLSCKLLLPPQTLHARCIHWDLSKKKNKKKQGSLVLLETVRSSYSQV